MRPADERHRQEKQVQEEFKKRQKAIEIRRKEITAKFRADIEAAERAAELADKASSPPSRSSTGKSSQGISFLSRRNTGRSSNSGSHSISRQDTNTSSSVDGSPPSHGALVHVPKRTFGLSRRTT